MREILVSRASPREIAVMENGRLCEYMRGKDCMERSAGDLVLGRVERVISGMDAAFVSIGEERNGFLPLKEKSDSFQGEARLRSGDRVLVQIIREAHGEKGAFLSRDCALKGEYVLYMPMNRFVGASAKMEASCADRWRQWGRERAAGQFGLVMRTACQTAESDAVDAEIAQLQHTWQQLSKAASAAPVGAVLLSEKDAMLENILKDYLPRGVDAVVSDDPSIVEAVGSMCPVRLVEADPLQTAGVPEKLHEATQRRVWLKSGANLVIDECEALTVIDVNTAKFTGKQRMEQNLTKVNREACAEIARQVRLRALGGILIIDMIDMTEERDREAVLTALREAFAQDREKTVIHGYTSLGLIEMTRRRTRISLREMMEQSKKRSKAEA